VWNICEIYVIWARMSHTSSTATPRNTVWKTKRGILKHYALVICIAYLDICMKYMHYALLLHQTQIAYSSSSSSSSSYSLRVLILFFFFLTMMWHWSIHSSQPCQDINNLFSPMFSLISVACLFGWDPQIWRQK